MKRVVSGHLSLELIERETEYWSTMKSVWNRCELSEGDSIETMVFKLYFRESNVNTVYKSIRAMGIAPAGFDSNSVSAIIREGNIEDQELQRYARSLLDGNSKQAQSFH